MENKHTILIVDDIPDNLQIIFEFLHNSNKNYNIVKAISGEMACRIMEKQVPSLVVTDWDMPGMDGIDLIKWMGDRPAIKHIPVIVATGVMTATQDLQAALEAGAVDYIRKPIDPIELNARVRSMLKLADSFREIQQLNATKDRFFSIIAHDLGSPFNGLQALSELLVSDFDEFTMEELKGFVHEIYNTSKNGYGLLQNLLEWSRSQMSLIAIEPQQIMLGNMVENIIELLMVSITGKQLQISSDIEPDLQVFADPNMLNSILLNLISNAIKFTHNGGGIKISAHKAKGNVQIAVSDNGIGISPANREKLFKIDGHPQTFGTNKERGTGLGLILCKEFIERNNGTIKVDSQSGKGSTFYVTIPCSE